jgi:1-deoxy-D-xylulose-5-phosphate reductoisomerase
LVNALVGIVGLLPTVRAIEIKRTIALANKETLVVAGDIINELLRIHGVELYPIDSEHSAIWQCLRGEDHKTISKLIITASGGSFRDYVRSHLESVTVEEALSHPNWSMGDKITIDSATMMNKGFEVIEAHHLFHLPPEAIETVIHRESIIHSMVEFTDHSIIAQLSDHDMHLPISYALFYPQRRENQVQSLNWTKLKQLTFSDVSFTRYPCLGCAYDALKRGGNAPAILNAANEAAVDLFLKRKISFLEIETIVGQAIQNNPWIDKPTLDELLKTDQTVKAAIYEHYLTRR